MATPMRKMQLSAPSVLLLVFMLLVGCGSNTGAATGRSAATAPTATRSSEKQLPTFADWRATYMGDDGALHAVTLDGKQDLVGPHISGLANLPNGLGLDTGGFSANGHLLAYSGDRIHVMDVRPSAIHPYVIGSGFTEGFIAWSPDSTRLATYENPVGIKVIDAATGITTDVSPVGNPGIVWLIGWLDPSHLLVTILPHGQSQMLSATVGDHPQCAPCETPTPTPPFSVAALTIATGEVRIIARIEQPTWGDPRFLTSPDGSHVLLWNSQFRGDPYTPLVDLIDTATGRITPLTNINRLTGSGFFQPVWEPGGDHVAVSNGQRIWILDTARDTALALHLPDSQVVEGWAPQSKTLIVGTGYQAGIDTGPFSLSALTFSDAGQVSIVPLTHSAMTFPFLGFARTM